MCCEVLNSSQFSKLTVACQTEHLLKKFRMVNPLSGGATGDGIISDYQNENDADLVAPG